MSSNNQTNAVLGPQTAAPPQNPPQAPIIPQANIFGMMPLTNANAIAANPNPILPLQLAANPPAQANNADDYDSDSDADSDDPAFARRSKLSPISLSISTSVSVTGSNNTISIDPAQSASQIAMNITAALRKMSSDGVPMVSDDGIARPIKLKVKADIKMAGSGNMLGDKAILTALAILRGKAEQIKEIRAIGASKKRERAAEEGEVEGEPKRVKKE